MLEQAIPPAVVHWFSRSFVRPFTDYLLKKETIVALGVAGHPGFDLAGPVSIIFNASDAQPAPGATESKLPVAARLAEILRNDPGGIAPLAGSNAQKILDYVRSLAREAIEGKLSSGEIANKLGLRSDHVSETISRLIYRYGATKDKREAERKNPVRGYPARTFIAPGQAPASVAPVEFTYMDLTQLLGLPESARAQAVQSLHSWIVSLSEEASLLRRLTTIREGLVNPPAENFRRLAQMARVAVAADGSIEAILLFCPSGERVLSDLTRRISLPNSASDLPFRRAMIAQALTEIRLTDPKNVRYPILLRRTAVDDNVETLLEPKEQLEWQHYSGAAPQPDTAKTAAVPAPSPQPEEAPAAVRADAAQLKTLREKWISVDQAAEQLGLAPGTLRSRIDQGLVAVTDVSQGDRHNYRISPEELRRLRALLTADRQGVLDRHGILKTRQRGTIQETLGWNLEPFFRTLANPNSSLDKSLLYELVAWNAQGAGGELLRSALLAWMSQTPAALPAWRERFRQLRSIGLLMRTLPEAPASFYEHYRQSLTTAGEAIVEQRVKMLGDVDSHTILAQAKPLLAGILSGENVVQKTGTNEASAGALVLDLRDGRWVGQVVGVQGKPRYESSRMREERTVRIRYSNGQTLDIEATQDLDVARGTRPQFFLLVTADDLHEIQNVLARARAIGPLAPQITRLWDPTPETSVEAKPVEAPKRHSVDLSARGA